MVKITKLYPASPDDVEYIEAALNELVTKTGARLISTQRRSDGLVWWVIYDTDMSSVKEGADV